MKISKKSFIFMGISSLTLVAYPAYVYSSSLNHNNKPKPKPSYVNNIWREVINSSTLPINFPYMTDINKVSNGINPSMIKPNTSKSTPDTTENKIYNDIVNKMYSFLIYVVNIKMSAATSNSIKTRYASILNTIKYSQANNLFTFQFSGESNITPGFSTPLNLKLISSDQKSFDVATFTINVGMTDKQKIDATTYWFSKVPFSDVSIPIDTKTPQIKNYSDALKTAIESSPQFADIDPVYVNIFKEESFKINPKNPTEQFIPNDLTGKYDILFNYKALTSTSINMTIAATDETKNAYLGTWSNKTNKALFLNAEDTFTITPSLFLNEPDLKSISIRHGKVEGVNILGGAPNIEILKISCKGITDIGSTMFYNNLKLTTLDLRGAINIKSIKLNAFRNAPINLIYGLNNLKQLTDIGDQAFQYSKFKIIDLSGNPLLEKIGNKAFGNVAYTTIDLSGDTKLKVPDAFTFPGSFGSITKLDLTGCASITTLDAFINGSKFQSLTSLGLSNMASLKSIPAGLFYNSKVTDINLSNNPSLETIGDQTFGQVQYTAIDLSGDTKLNISDANIFRGAFWNISKLDLSGCSSMTTLNSFQTTGYYRVTNLLDLSGMTSLKSIPDNMFKDIRNEAATTIKIWKGFVTPDSKATAIFGGHDKMNIEYSYQNKINKPQTAGGSITGVDGKATYTPPTLTGTTVSADKTSNLSNGDKIKVTYSLTSGNVWQDESVLPITLTYNVENLHTGVIKPTKAGGTVTGLNGAGVYTPPTLTGTTITADKSTSLSNGDNIKVTYALKPGYAWVDGTNKDIILNYVVGNLNIPVVIPKVAGGTVAGLNGKATYTPPTLTGTDVSTTGKTTNLSNGDEIKVTYALKAGYAWNDGKTDSIILTYKVENLHAGVIKPTVAGGSVTGPNGAGVYTLPTLTGTTVTADKTTGLS